MSEERPRRYKAAQPPEVPSGYRQSRRGSKAAKSAKRADRQHRAFTGLSRLGKGARNLLYVAAWALGAVGLALLAILLVATAVNTIARWSAQREAQQSVAPARRALQAKEDVLVIATEGDRATGFLAMRVDSKGGQVYGIAIPDGAFIDVPGQGFERIGEAYEAGADVALSAVSNYLTVPFKNYVVVPKAAYAAALREMSVDGVVAATTESNLNAAELKELGVVLGRIDQENVALVPMPVKPIKLGDQTYFEPQRKEIADLLRQWWGVDASKEVNAVRVIVYNGVGKPGAAGEAAQQLIRGGFRVVDTKNADRFDYDKTKVIVRRGTAAQGEAVRAAHRSTRHRGAGRGGEGRAGRGRGKLGPLYRGRDRRDRYRGQGLQAHARTRGRSAVNSSKEFALVAADAATDKKAVDVIAIEVSELLVVTDYFVICSGNTDIQVRAIADQIEDRLREECAIKPIGREGVAEGKWVLLDFGDLVVHVFQPEERAFYRLETLWGDAPRLDLPGGSLQRQSAPSEDAE